MAKKIDSILYIGENATVFMHDTKVLVLTDIGCMSDNVCSICGATDFLKNAKYNLVKRNDAGEISERYFTNDETTAKQVIEIMGFKKYASGKY